MTTTVKVMADSVNSNGDRIITVLAHYPRFIHAQFLMHRAFSRNSSSSRAIPYERMRDAILADPAMPCEWGKNQKGMQAKKEQADAAGCTADALDGLRCMCAFTDTMHKRGVHKQIVNRYLEPWAHIDTLITGMHSDYKAFLALRLPEDAQPDIQLLAQRMRDAIDESLPKATGVHMPFLREGEDHTTPWIWLRLAARACRLSYGKVDGGNATAEDEIALAMDLLRSRHASPFEHQAQAFTWEGRTANLRGWRSQRTMLEITGKM